jgi:hypothetical protein
VTCQKNLECADLPSIAAWMNHARHRSPPNKVWAPAICDHIIAGVGVCRQLRCVLALVSRYGP